MKRFVVVLFILLSVTSIAIFFLNTESEQESESELISSSPAQSTIDSIPTQSDEGIVLPTEQFIMQHLMHEDGTIRTDVKGNSNWDVALSESIGLWMEYLVEKRDASLFEDVFQTNRDLFLTKENIMMWRMEEGQVATSNALIDDIRVMEALFKEGERIDNTKYKEQAKEIGKAILKYNRQSSHFVDFYDTEHKEKGNLLTLSYVNPTAFQYMTKYDILSKEALNHLKQFMQGVPLDNGFYPKTYSYADQSFLYDDTINLIDQLYVALHMERFDIQTERFYEWINETFYKENRLYGRYDRETKINTVDYEAAAVYALAILYSLEREENTFAKDVYEQMIRLRNNDPDSQQYGGYIFSNTTHSFDNLLALLAERKLLNEQVIEQR